MANNRSAGNKTRQPNTSGYNGIYLGHVRDNSDAKKDGRLSVWIPDTGNTGNSPSGLHLLSYMSPFAGATEKWSVGNNDKVFEQTQTAYGFWMVPPDIDAQVGVFFANGDPAMGYWFGCTYQELTNYSVPGVAASKKNHRDNSRNLPVAEHNKRTTTTPLVDNTTRPTNDIALKGIRNQGLASDPYRGYSSSSAKREAPSQVYGISTPGPKLPGSEFRRTGGHQFVMDDLEGNEHFTLRTKSGAQIKIDETNGYTYIINKKGTAWVQLDADGNVDIFSAKSMSIRSQEDINFRADKDINIEAGNNINLKAAMDWSGSSGIEIAGESAGSGGNIKIQANANFDLVVAVDSKIKTEGKLDINTTGNNTMSAGGDTDIKSGSNHNQEAGSETNIKSGANHNQESGAATNIKAGASIANEAGASFSAKAGPDITMSAGAINLNGSPAPVAGPASIAADAADAEKPALNDKTNVLEAFESDNIGEAKYYERKTQDGVQTVASRFPTYEPCPDHIKK